MGETVLTIFIVVTASVLVIAVRDMIVSGIESRKVVVTPVYTPAVRFKLYRFQEFRSPYHDRPSSWLLPFGRPDGLGPARWCLCQVNILQIGNEKLLQCFWGEVSELDELRKKREDV